MLDRILAAVRSLVPERRKVIVELAPVPAVVPSRTHWRAVSRSHRWG